MAGFTFVGREAEISMFRRLLERPRGELLVVAGAEGSGKSHLLHRLRSEAERPGRHFVQFGYLGHLTDADVQHYAILAAAAAGHGREPAKGGASAEAAPAVQLVPNPKEFFNHLILEDRRPPAEKLLSLFAAASAHLPRDARLVLLLDLGRGKGDEPFPLEFLARRLPEKVKVVAAVADAPPALGGLDNATLLNDLPPLARPDVERLVAFHCKGSPGLEGLAAAAFEKFGGEPMATDLAAKLAAGAPDPAEALRRLPAGAAELCRKAIERLSDEQRRLAECIARVPSGVDVASLRALLGFADPDLRRLLRTDEIRNLVLIHRAARGAEARLFHEALADQFLAGKPPSAAFHQRAAAFFLAAAESDGTNVEALAAHAYHLRLSGDRRQFVEDFPKTYKAKHSLRLFRHLASEYRFLIECCNELGEETINRPVCVANLGRVYQQLGQNADALRCHREALELYQSQRDNSGTAAQLANIASVLRDLGQLDEAADHLERAAALDEAAGNNAALAADLNNLGILCQRLERYDEAFKHHQRALALHREVSNDLGVANQLANMAAIHRKRGDLESARNCYQEAWRLDNRNQSPLAEIADLCNLGLIFEELGDMEKAVTCYQQAIELDRVVADRESEASHLRTLAAMHRKRGEDPEAVALLQQALDIDRSLGNPKGEVADLIALGGACGATGDTAAARELLGRAATFAAKLADADAEARARHALERLGQGPDAEPAPDEPPPPETRTSVLREPAADGIWDNLQLIDGPIGQDAPAASPTPEPAPDEPDPQADAPVDLEEYTTAALRRELADARRRIAELEEELEEYKTLVRSLKTLVGDANRRD